MIRLLQRLLRPAKQQEVPEALPEEAMIFDPLPNFVAPALPVTWRDNPTLVDMRQTYPEDFQTEEISE